LADVILDEDDVEDGFENEILLLASPLLLPVPETEAFISSTVDAAEVMVTFVTLFRSVAVEGVVIVTLFISGADCMLEALERLSAIEVDPTIPTPAPLVLAAAMLLEASMGCCG